MTLRVIVEGRVLLGRTLSEIGTQLQCSERTAAAYWNLASRWLTERMIADGKAA